MSGLIFSRPSWIPDGAPEDSFTWVERTIVIGGEESKVIFPEGWDASAIRIVASRYFRGQGEDKEIDLRHLVRRVIDKYQAEAKAHGVFASNASLTNWVDTLVFMLYSQKFSFNSPVWFNVGREEDPQISACFILGVEDSMESILDWYATEGKIFTDGSGSGVNLSALRAKGAPLSGGGESSGPVSFMRGADAIAGTIRAGGTTRRAAKMVILDGDHPDVEDFIGVKAHEEKKVRALMEAGFDMRSEGGDITSIQYQNGNNSVRLTNELMELTQDGESNLLDLIAQAAWECGDPGVQFADTIQAWHTSPASGKINASNPCAEYMHIDDSACNLASLNLMAFRSESKLVDLEMMAIAIHAVVIAMDLSIDFGSYPTHKIKTNVLNHRQLGLGYANLAAWLMSLGVPYASEEACKLTSAITAFINAVAHHTSAELAKERGAYPALTWRQDGYSNEAAHNEVVERHRHALVDLMFVEEPPLEGHELFLQLGREALGWYTSAIALAQQTGWRNAQMTALAPTGTIGYMMGCETTGIEPMFSLNYTKHTVEGEVLHAVSKVAQKWVREQGVTSEFNGDPTTLPILESDKHVLRCASGWKPLTWREHLAMVAAAQPHISGGISKTVNLSRDATPEDIKEAIIEAWHLGLKAVSIFRDGCKGWQPLNTHSAPKEEVERAMAVHQELAATSVYRHEVTLAGTDISLTVLQGPTKVLLEVGKHGTTLAGMAAALSSTLTAALANGARLDSLLTALEGITFAPRGLTSDPDIRFASSLVDYVAKRLTLDLLDGTLDLTPQDVPRPLSSGAAPQSECCTECGELVRPSGSCSVCPNCGLSTGCS